MSRPATAGQHGTADEVVDKPYVTTVRHGRRHRRHSPSSKDAFNPVQVLLIGTVAVVLFAVIVLLSLF